MSHDSVRNYAMASGISRRSFLQVSTLLLGAGAAADQASAATGVTSEVATPVIDHRWKTVPLAEVYSDPIVVTGPLSFSGHQPATSRLRNVTDSAFDIRVEEWMYLDDWHKGEVIGLLVTDRGMHSLPDGTPIEVGRAEVDNEWASVTFESEFSTTPVVMSQVQTVNGGQPVTTRHRNVTSSGMDVRLQEEEAQGWHKIERIGYVAIPPGSGTFNDNAFEAGVAADVTNEWQTITFEGSYDQPVILADIQTFDGNNTCALRYRNLTGSSVEMKLQEEQSVDDEMWHLPERVGYVVFERTGGPIGYGSSGYGVVGYGQ